MKSAVIKVPLLKGDLGGSKRLMGKFREKKSETEKSMVKDTNGIEKGVIGAHIFPWWNNTWNHSKNQEIHGIFFEWGESW